MTASSGLVEKIANRIKKIKPSAYLLWGGVHATLYPEESIAFVDAICVGEGERPMAMFLENALKDNFATDIPGMWIKKENIILKNQKLPLNTSELLGSFPHSYFDDSIIYDKSVKQFRIFHHLDYSQFNGLLFRTLWTLGCPFDCSFCANDSFIKLDSGYRRLRHAPVDYILDEIKIARKKYPFISTIAFYDDNFIALPFETIQEFSKKYKKEIDLPFVVFGIHPNTLRKDKVELLAAAGMNRTRMGVQSGSTETLKFFARGTDKKRIVESANVLTEAAKKHKMIPPAFDIISDNPVETIDNKIETLELLYSIKRPFTLIVFSLRVFPGTSLFDYVQENLQLVEYFKKSSYLSTKKNMNNIILYLLAICRPPRFLFDELVSIVRKNGGEEKEYPLLYQTIYFIYLANRAWVHLFKFDFSIMVGRWTYYLWTLKPRRAWHWRKSN